jgi:hypothetical protein
MFCKNVQQSVVLPFFFDLLCFVFTGRGNTFKQTLEDLRSMI